MNALLWLLISTIAIWAILILLNRFYNVKKRGFEISPGVLMWRTKRGLKTMACVARKLKRGWIVFGTIAGAVGLALMVLMFVTFAQNAWLTLQHPGGGAPGAMIVLPGLVPGLSLLLWLVVIASVLIVHEFAHGFVALAQGLKTKSMGLLLFTIIPGGFVELDEKKFEKASTGKRLRVLGAGSFSNIIFSIICLAVVLVALAPKPGVYITSVVENAPSEDILSPGMHLTGLVPPGNSEVRVENLAGFHEIMENIKPEENLGVITDEGIFFIITGKYPGNENRGYLGVYTYSAAAAAELVGVDQNLFGVKIASPRAFFMDPALTSTLMIFCEFRGYPLFHPYCYDAHLPWQLIQLLKWMFFLNFGIGLFNLLPMAPLDGGGMVKAVSEKYTSKRNARRITNVLSAAVLVLLIVNLLPLVW